MLTTGETLFLTGFALGVAVGVTDTTTVGLTATGFWTTIFSTGALSFTSTAVKKDKATATSENANDNTKKNWLLNIFYHPLTVLYQV